MGRLSLVAAVCLATLLDVAAAADGVQAASARVGESIYVRGIVGSGAALKAVDDAGVVIEGQAAACVNCHRRSALGSREGRSLIPPIAGRYLFRPRNAVGEDADLPFVEGVRDRRAPYTDATLTRAVRNGIDAEGRALKPLMPRFQIGDSDIEALIAYLRSLDQRNVPGVSPTTLHFATIITPDADPVQRDGMLGVMRQYFAERNARQMSPAPRMRSAHVIEFMVHRKWELHVWQLSGTPKTWGEQLDHYLQTQPVFAVLSGLGGRDWRPVHTFCERARVPCLFPNVEVPVDAQRDFYPLYFSKGVLLEAEMIAERIQATAGDASAYAVHQVYRANDAGAAAAQRLAAILGASGVPVVNHVLTSVAGPDLAAAVRASAPARALVLWLRPEQIATLGDVEPPAADIYMSGRMAGLEHAPLPPSWRARTQVAYPFDLPDRRRVRMDFAFGWFRIRHIDVVAEQIQADTLLACGLLSETLNHMSDTFVRDYLVERIEDMLAHRVLTGYYPRLSLAPGQRFASKGGYFVRFGQSSGPKLVATGDWLVP